MFFVIALQKLKSTGIPEILIASRSYVYVELGRPVLVYFFSISYILLTKILEYHDANVTFGRNTA